MRDNIDNFGKKEFVTQIDPAGDQDSHEVSFRELADKEGRKLVLEDAETGELGSVYYLEGKAWFARPGKGPIRLISGRIVVAPSREVNKVQVSSHDGTIDIRTVAGVVDIFEIDVDEDDRREARIENPQIEIQQVKGHAKNGILAALRGLFGKK